MTSRAQSPSYMPQRFCVHVCAVCGRIAIVAWSMAAISSSEGLKALSPRTPPSFRCSCLDEPVSFSSPRFSCHPSLSSHGSSYRSGLCGVRAGAALATLRCDCVAFSLRGPGCDSLIRLATRSRNAPIYGSLMRILQLVCAIAVAGGERHSCHLYPRRAGKLSQRDTLSFELTLSRYFSTFAVFRTHLPPSAFAEPISLPRSSSLDSTFQKIKQCRVATHFNASVSVCLSLCVCACYFKCYMGVSAPSVMETAVFPSYSSWMESWLVTTENANSVSCIALFYAKIHESAIALSPLRMREIRNAFGVIAGTLFLRYRHLSIDLANNFNRRFPFCREPPN